MNNDEFYKRQLSELIHFLNTPLSTISLASRTFLEFSNDNETTEEFITSLELIQSAIKKINKHLSDVDSQMSKLDKKG